MDPEYTSGRPMSNIRSTGAGCKPGGAEHTGVWANPSRLTHHYDRGAEAVPRRAEPERISLASGGTMVPKLSNGRSGLSPDNYQQIAAQLLVPGAVPVQTPGCSEAGVAATDIRAGPVAHG